MKIAIVMWDLRISGGGPRQALELANYLVNENHDVKIYCVYLNKENCYPDLIKNFNIFSLYHQDFTSSLNLNILKRGFELFSLREANKLVNLMEPHFDIVNCHDHSTYRVGSIYKKNYGVPVIWMMNDLPSNFRIPKIKRSIRSLLRLLLFSFLGGTIGRYLEKKRITKIDQIVVLDKRNRNLVKEHIGLEAKIIRSGVNIENFEFHERKFDPKKNKFKILTTGIFFPHRRFEDLIMALDILKKEGYPTQLNLIGSDAYDKAYTEKIHKLVSKLNLDKHVNFLGAVSEKELVRNYSESDVFVFPNYPQTWGLAVFEAMSCGTPVVVSTGCGASELLIHGENALLVHPKRPEEIAACLKQLFNDARLWEYLSINGRKFVEENIRWDLYGKKMLELFKEVIRETNLVGKRLR